CRTTCIWWSCLRRRRALVQKLQALLGRTLLPRKRGPKPKDKKKGRRNQLWRPRNQGIQG
ncbi:MAG: hypothetical protein WBF17_21595, partial [Phycisphaerae bacterium]